MARHAGGMSVSISSSHIAAQSYASQLQQRPLPARQPAAGTDDGFAPLLLKQAPKESVVVAQPAPAQQPAATQSAPDLRAAADAPPAPPQRPARPGSTIDIRI